MNTEATTNYLDLCKLEIYFAVCRDDYTEAIIVDADIIMKYLYGHITQLKQHWINNGKYMNDIPNDLFFTFTVFSEILP